MLGHGVGDGHITKDHLLVSDIKLLVFNKCCFRCPITSGQTAATSMLFVSRCCDFEDEEEGGAQER